MAGSDVRFEPLKRTFHGCMTCRKRKVRCRGGSPCQNCVRMNITCHSSFDNNLRVCTPNPVVPKADERPHSSKTAAPRPAEHESATSSSQAAWAAPTLDQYAATLATFAEDTAPVSLPITDASSYSHPMEQTRQFETLFPEQGHVLDVDTLSLTGPWDLNFSSFLLDNTSASLGQPVLPLPRSRLQPFRPSSGQADAKPSTSDGSALNIIQAQVAGTEEWTPRRKKRPKASTSKPSLAEGDDYFIAHYASCAQGLTTRQDAAWSYHRFILELIKSSDPRFPVRLAVLAWSAKHAARHGSRVDEKAWEGYYTGATTELNRMLSDQQYPPNPSSWMHSRNPAVNTKSEVVLITALYLNRCDVLNEDIAAVAERNRKLRVWLETLPNDLDPSAFACVVIRWLCYLDLRINLFSPPRQDRNSLLSAVMQRPEYYRLLEKSHMHLPELFGDSLPEGQLAQEIEKINPASRLFDVFCLFDKLQRYRIWFHSTSDDHDPRLVELRTAKIAVVDSDIRRLEAQFELIAATDPTAGILQGILRPYPPPASPTTSTTTTTATATTSPATAATTSRLPSPSLTNASSPGPQPSSRLLAGPEPRDRISLHWLTAYAAFMTAKILWSRLLYPDIRSDPQCAAAVDHIMAIALCLRGRHGAAGDGGGGASKEQAFSKVITAMLWPLPLFIAGVETMNEVYADWIHEFVEQVGASAASSSSGLLDGGGYPTGTSSKAGGHPSKLSGVGGGAGGGGGGGGSGGAGGRKVLELMGRVRERQNALGRRVDVSEIVEEMSGGKGPFVF